MTTTVTEAGRKGGFAVLEKHGRSFYSDIGKKGQQVMRERYPNMASEWGRLGGRPKKLTLDQIAGEKGK
jgi:general stress protein YciG